MIELNIDVMLADVARRDDGVILLTMGRNTRSINKTSDRELIVAIDQEGAITWQRDLAFATMDCRRSNQETLLVMGSHGSIVELDRTGEQLNEWSNADLGTLKMHHSVSELPDGKLVTLSADLIAGASDDSDWPDLMADTVLIFDREGTVETEFSLAPLLDMDRHTHSHLIPYWPLLGFDGCADWTHGNSVTVDPADGGLIVSLRHQDAVIKLTRSGELVWILGDSTGWKTPWSDKLLQLDGQRPFAHQHDAGFAPDGTLLLFDNGTVGELEDRQSFALGYRIDEVAMTATEVWRYGGDDLPYSDYVSGVTMMPNGNRFIACTGIKLEPDGSRAPLPPRGIGSIELCEVTPDGERVFHARIEDPEAGRDEGWNGFRPQYLPADFLID